MKGFTSHKSMGLKRLPNPDYTGGYQPGMLKMEDVDGVAWYVFMSTAGDVMVHSAAPTTPASDGTVVGTQS